ncbi:bifunctional chorismate mutase/prephenate dehydrogenase [Chroococcus sp. FPU101]|uniref:bifunctional chorismate mutase/prephenate dehydrogenase n=1 Tax=Chroococcus sp. FPU101 TaxID=1974212 RepID=UPI001A8D24C9|nr:bifunctional chorismate mutase/prephenate dehydrogenase [Chroococcus sp. FPU101]GFE70099.1 Prephenate dehydrogenase [Chroococcus sp. FPU101]
MLPAINKELISLLGQKITSKANPEPDADLIHLLAENGVPEFVWKSLILNCTAARTNPKSPLSNPPQQVTIIGGCGKMGCLFGDFIAQFGHCVNNLSRKNWSEAPQLLGQADLVLIAVPIEETLTVIEKASQYLEPKTVLADLTSIKTQIVSAMLEHHSGPVLGLHPMFGPGVQSLMAQNVIVCPGRNIEACQWFLDLMENSGAKLSICTSEEHDRMMANIQAIRHFITFSLGVFLAQEGLDLAQTLNFASPLYRLQLDLVSRLFAQDSSLSFKLMLASPEHQAAIARLEKTIAHLAQAITTKDQTILEQAFEQSNSFFRADANRAIHESNYLIDRLSIFLAAQDNSELT